MKWGENMMEIIEIVAYWLFGAVIGAVLAGLVSFLLKDKLSERKISRLEEECEDLEADLRTYKAAEYATKGNTKRAEAESRMESAMGEAVVLMKSGKPPIEVMKEVAAKYPDVAIKLAKKYGLGI